MKTTVHLTILVTLLVIGAGCFASGWEPCGEDPLMGKAMRRFIPKYHNNIRRREQASAMMKLVWSQELAKRAREQALKCEFKQTIMTDCSGRPLVQNMYMESGALPGAVHVNWRRVLGNWKRQKRFYTYDTNSCKSGEICTLYKRMVRDVHRWVGCSYARCPVVSVGLTTTWKNVVLYVCNYRGTGRKSPSGFKPYTAGQQCTDCAKLVTRGYSCKDNLCHNCIWKKNHQCTCIPKKCLKAGGRYSTKLCKCVCKRGYWGDLCEYPCECRNTWKYCNSMPKSFCNKPQFYKWLRQKCAAACDGVCDALQPPPNARC